MCRLFAFRSVIQSQTHKSLLSADNALALQGQKHPDGWGIAYYVSGAPHIIKSEKSVFKDQLFSKVSGIVSSETVIAHIRKATQGEINITNTHPFQYGNWTFAHNGHIANFEKYRSLIRQKIAPGLARFILGETDSELIFFSILNNLSQLIPLNRPDCSIETLIKATRRTIDELVRIIGPIAREDNNDLKQNYLTFVITNGATMLAHQGGKTLMYSTYKKKCDEKNTCPSYTDECENPSKTGSINHLIFSSENLKNDNIWLTMTHGQIIGADWKMKMLKV